LHGETFTKIWKMLTFKQTQIANSKKNRRFIAKKNKPTNPSNPMKPRTNQPLKFTLSLGLLACLSGHSFAQTTRTWDAGGGTDLNWATAENWSDDTIPGAAEFAAFGTAGAITDVTGTTNVVDSNRTSHDLLTIIPVRDCIRLHALKATRL
jgi:hypothetical protein